MTNLIETKKKILVVEDEAPLRNALVDVLLHEGFDVISAKDGQEGLALALGEKPDVILLDMMMPIMDGMTMLKLLRQDRPYGAKAAVIVLTNQGMFSNEDLSKEVNLSEPLYYLVKSNWPIENVVKKVKQALNRPIPNAELLSRVHNIV